MSDELMTTTPEGDGVFTTDEISRLIRQLVDVEGGLDRNDIDQAITVLEDWQTSGALVTLALEGRVKVSWDKNARDILITHV